MTLSSCCCHYPLVCCSKSSVRSDLPNLPKKPSCEKVVIEQKSADEGKCEILLKSCLKKLRVSDSEQNVKGNVKWLDFLGKELVEIKEFEPTEVEESTRTTMWGAFV